MPRRVLLVEEDTRLLEQHQELIASVNPHFECVAMSTMGDALKALRDAEAFFIVLTDLHLEGESLAGIGVVKEAVRAGVRAVYVMGKQVDRETVELALASGACGVLRKGNADIMVGQFTRCFRYERIVP